MLFFIFLTLFPVAFAAPTVQCDLTKVAIVGGDYTVSNESNKGSIVLYSCPDGQYPHPAYIRECQYNGRWTQQKEKAICKDVRCPSPVMFEGGEYFPRQNIYNVGDVLTFECWDGFKLHGSVNRTCQENAKWSGTTTICDASVGECPSPGIPIGATKAGTGYKVEDKVIYECQTGQKMFGSKERVCLENHQWSGAEPECRMWYTYDTPEEVAKDFFTTISANLEGVDLDKEEDEFSERKINIKQGGLMNIFFVLDASKSVKDKDFKTARESCEILINKLSSFDIVPRYSVISYAAKAIEIVALRDEESLDAEAVILKLKKFNRNKQHEDKQGTNTRAALLNVYNMLVEQEHRDNENFMKTQNVIVLMTDGKFNMGGDPREAVNKIREILAIKDREEFLDIYVFGLGEGIDQIEINDLASKKDKEVHNFHLKNADAMKEAFEQMIDETGAMDMCGIFKENSKEVSEKYPWIAKILINRPGAEEKCKGSIVTNYFIVTAAHCFHLDENIRTISVYVGGKQYRVKNLKRHPKYDPAAKLDKNVPKTFDYDLALIELTEKIKFSSEARPICIPCTKSASWALKKPLEGTTCKDHLKTLLSEDLVKANFIAEEDKKEMEPKSVQIKQGIKRNGCLEDAKLVKQFENVSNINDVVTDQFLCTGGIEPVVDDITCQGDSGGPLLVPYRNGKRYIQVGVISWGTVIHCVKSTRKKTPVPKEARDFHFNIFEGLNWLEENLNDQGLDFFQ
ncbi:complement factor B-like [Discoglossus pictus]